MLTQTPSYLYVKLRFAQSNRTLNLIPAKFSYAVSSRMFFVVAAKLWNSLPMHIKIIKSQVLFKQAVSLFFSN